MLEVSNSTIFICEFTELLFSEKYFYFFFQNHNNSNVPPAFSLATESVWSSRFLKRQKWAIRRHQSKFLKSHERWGRGARSAPKALPALDLLGEALPNPWDYLTEPRLGTSALLFFHTLIAREKNLNCDIINAIIKLFVAKMIYVRRRKR